MASRLIADVSEFLGGRETIEDQPREVLDTNTLRFWT